MNNKDKAGWGRTIGLALAFGALAPIVAHAQLAVGRGPIAYSADKMEYNDGERRLTLTGNVDLLQNDARMQANKLTLYFNKSAKTDAAPAAAPPSMGSGDIDHIVAEGDVHFVRPQQKARGDNAVYQAATDTVTFSGNVIISSDDNVIRGETLVMEVGSGRTTLKPTGKPGERVRGVLSPKSHQTTGG